MKSCPNCGNEMHQEEWIGLIRPLGKKIEVKTWKCDCGSFEFINLDTIQKALSEK